MIKDAFVTQNRYNLHPYTTEVANEHLSARGNAQHRWGRQEGARLQRLAAHYPEIPELRGPWLDWIDVAREASEVTGWERFEGGTIIHGTSNNRMDKSEIFKNLALVQALQDSGQPNHSVGYFIDPFAHTTKEMLSDVAADFGIQTYGLVQNFALQQRRDVQIPNPQAAGEFMLPPYFYEPPTHAVVEGLDLPDSVKAIMHRALEQDLTHFGDFRIASDAVFMQDYLQRTGYKSDAFKVISFEDFLRKNTNLSLGAIAQRASHSHETYRPYIFGANDNGKPPVILRYVWNGSRINIDANFEAFEEDITDGRKPIMDPNVLSFCREIQNTPLVNVMEKHPINFGGVGYALSLGLTAEADVQEVKGEDRKPKALFVVDNYDLPGNMALASMEMMRQDGLTPVWVAKGTVGRKLNDGRVDFWTPYDALCDAERTDEELFAQDKKVITELASILRDGDIHSLVGSYYDTYSQTLVGPHIVPVPQRTLDLIQNDGTLPDNELDVRIKPQSRKESWTIVNALTGVTPDKVGSVVFGLNEQQKIFFETPRNVEIAILSLQYVRDLMGPDRIDQPSVDNITTTLTAIKEIHERSLLLNQELARAFSPEDWKKFWQNKVQATFDAAQSHGVMLPEGLTVTDSDEPIEAQKRADVIVSEIKKGVRDSLTLELADTRPDPLKTAHEIVHMTDQNLQLFKDLKTLRHTLQKPQGIEIRKQLGLSESISGDEIDAMINAASVDLGRNVDQIKTEFPHSIQDSEGTDEDVIIFDNRNNITKEFKTWIDNKRKVLSFLSRLSDLSYIAQKGYTTDLDVASPSFDLLQASQDGKVITTDDDEMKRVADAWRSTYVRVEDALIKKIIDDVRAKWDQLNEHAIPDAIAKRKKISQMIFEDVTQALEPHYTNLEAEADTFIGRYNSWRNSMIRTLASDGIELK